MTNQMELIPPQPPLIPSFYPLPAQNLDILTNNFLIQNLHTIRLKLMSFLSGNVSLCMILGLYANFLSISALMSSPELIKDYEASMRRLVV